MESKFLFFRNDDLGWMPQHFERLLELFRKHELYMCAAAIPLYSKDSYKPGAFAKDKNVLEIHSHGYSHLDHQNHGKKAEFGSERSLDTVRQELLRSREITQSIFGDLYFEAFTPPWNRIEESFYALLPEAGFKVLSRDGDKIADVAGLKNLNIDVDVHTSKKGKIQTTKAIWAAIEDIWKQKDLCGIMLHHKHMDDLDYEVLDLLLGEIKKRQVRVLNYRQIFDRGLCL